MRALLDLLARLIAALLRSLQWLILPVVLLLFLQWPLRDLVRSHSREANDLGQWIFALYVAASVTAATRAHTHLAADAVARRYGLRIRAGLVRCGRDCLAFRGCHVRGVYGTRGGQPCCCHRRVRSPP
jgi:TRAP-type C4-dicarboxylate transport system permease small subunit